MKHVNINSNVFDEPEFSDATLRQVGIWLKLFVYCAKQENRGVIVTAGAWSESHCQRVLGCTREELQYSPLWELRSNGLLNLHYYNLVAEDFAIKRRRSHSMAVSARSAAKTGAAQANGQKGGRPCKIIQMGQAS